MKNVLFLFAALPFLVAACADIRVESPKSAPPAKLTAEKAGQFFQGTVRHVVLFKFKDTATPQQVQAVEKKFRELPSHIPQIMAFEWGTDISPEGKAQGFTHCFFLTFATPADRDAYLPHPAHKEFGATLRPYLDKVLVIDYVAKD